MVGGVVTGALAGLKADLVSGGLTFGAGLLVGGVLGALGAAGLARGYNLVRGADVTVIIWSDEVLGELVVSALLGYLAVAHYGRGRGDWAPSEYPAHWQDTVLAVFELHQQAFRHAWSLRGSADASETIAPALRDALAATARTVLQRLYADVRID
jgi:hypothetical protein